MMYTKGTLGGRILYAPLRPQHLHIILGERPVPASPRPTLRKEGGVVAPDSSLLCEAKAWLGHATGITETRVTRPEKQPWTEQLPKLRPHWSKVNLLIKGQIPLGSDLMTLVLMLILVRLPESSRSVT